MHVGVLACCTGDLLRMRLGLELLCGDDVGGLAEENDFGLLEIATGVCSGCVSGLYVRSRDEGLMAVS